jgi:hypothetical protein
VSTTTVGVEQIVPGLTIVTDPATTSSAPTTTIGFALNIADLQQFEAPTMTTTIIVARARAELTQSNVIVPKEVKSSDVNAQMILLVIIGSLIIGAVVFIVLGEHRLRNRRALSRAKR